MHKDGYYLKNFHGEPQTYTLYDLVLLAQSIAMHDGCERNEITFVQFTGLKDKNGKEIYEGDILTYSTMKAKVVFNEEHAAFELCQRERIDNPISDSWEVIGNIYETPEKLK